jgi:hypothetical protein
MDYNDTRIDMEKILQFADTASKNFKAAYNELRFAGYLTWLGGLLIFLTFIFSVLGGVGLTPQGQVLFVTGGIFLMLLGGGFLTLQNILTFRLKAQSQRHLFETTKLKHALQLRLAESSETSAQPSNRDFVDG